MFQQNSDWFPSFQNKKFGGPQNVVITIHSDYPVSITQIVQKTGFIANNLARSEP